MLAGRFLVELTPNGPRNVTYLAETGGVRGWSHDGRFLAFTTTDPYPPEILDFSGGMPVPVAVTPRTGAIFQWSNSDSRYAFVPYKTVTDVTSVVVVDAATGIEQVVDVLANGLELATWSWNDHHVALAGDRLWLIDTSGAELAALQIYDRDADDPQWSPNSRYLAFAAHLPPPDEGTRRLYVYDTIAGTLDLVNEDRWNVGLEFTWAGDSELIMGLEDEAFFLDLDAGSLTWLPFVTYGEDGGFGSVSPGGRCYVYDGYCEAAGEDGICIKTLPPDPQKPSVLIHRYDHESWTKRWSGNGDQLLLASGAAPWLINVETNGGEFGLGELRRRLVTIGTNTSSVRSVIGWNPNGRSDWITYSATPSRAGDVSAHPRLWNSENGRSFDVDVGSALQGWAWSRDGRYLVIKSGPTTADGMYHVQSVLDGELGDLWEVDLISPGGSNLWPIYLQP
jgi:hypothetical protein